MRVSSVFQITLVTDNNLVQNIKSKSRYHACLVLRTTVTNSISYQDNYI